MRVLNLSPYRIGSQFQSLFLRRVVELDITVYQLYDQLPCVFFRVSEDRELRCTWKEGVTITEEFCLQQSKRTNKTKPICEDTRKCLKSVCTLNFKFRWIHRLFFRFRYANFFYFVTFAFAVRRTLACDSMIG